MSIKVTVIGGAGGPEPAPAPGTVKPTVLPGSVLPGSTRTVTAMPSAPATPVVAAPPVFAASALPGVQRKPVEVPLTELARRFPHAEAAALQRTQGVLAGLHVQSLDASGWLRFGMPEQEELAALIRQRLQLAQEATTRSVPQHLRRLHELLSDVLEALDGGFFRKPAAAVWAGHEAEVAQLEALLGASRAALSDQLQALGLLRQPVLACGQRLEASALAAEYLLDHLGADAGGLLLARLTSLTGSQAMLQEHRLHLAQDASRLQELMTWVQDGVLLKLPAVHAQLAGLASRPSETQRFLAAEKLHDILQTLKRAL